MIERIRRKTAEESLNEAEMLKETATKLIGMTYKKNRSIPRTEMIFTGYRTLEVEVLPVGPNGEEIKMRILAALKKRITESKKQFEVVEALS